MEILLSSSLMASILANAKVSLLSTPQSQLCFYRFLTHGTTDNSLRLVTPTAGWNLTSAVPGSSLACGDSVSRLGPGYCPYRDPVWIFLSDFLALRAALLERMLLFVHELHSPENRAGPSWAEGTQEAADCSSKDSLSYIVRPGRHGSTLLSFQYLRQKLEGRLKKSPLSTQLEASLRYHRLFQKL